MKDLLTFLIKNITGSTDFTVDETKEEGKVSFFVKANPEVVGLIIGKEGKTIKNIRRIVSVRATLEDKVINISVAPLEA
jgi:uncharacterized protein